MFKASHGGHIWEYSQQQRKNLLDFSANINPLGLPQGVKPLIRRSLNFIAHYPDHHGHALKRVLAESHGISEQNILLGNGSVDLIYRITELYQSAQALIPVPTFSEYEYAARAHRIRCHFIKRQERDHFKPDIKTLTDSLRKMDLLFICHPNNPTGDVMPREDLQHVLAACRKHKTKLVIDEAFLDFHPEESSLSFIREAAGGDSLIVIRSMTKIYALAGLRLGYLVAGPGIIRQLNALQYPWCVNTLAQLCGEHVLADTGYIQKTRPFIHKERTFLMQHLRALPGLKVFPSQANFVLCKIERKQVGDAGKLKDTLLKKNILIRNCADFRGLDGRFFRVAVKKRVDNEILINALRKVFP